MSRLLPPEPSEYTDDQRRIAYSISGSRGSIKGPFGPWLHVPGFADPAQQTGQFLRFGSAMPGNLRELIICNVGQHWKADFEWYAHAPLAVEEGVSPQAIELLRLGEVPVPLNAQEKNVYELTREILTTGRLGDLSYEKGAEILGKALMVELVALCGYYSLVSFTLNVFNVPVPEGNEKPFKNPNL